MATQYSNKPIVTNGLVYALDFGNQKSYVSGSSSARSLVFNPTPATFQTVPAGDYSNLAAAYSVRKVVSSYTGSAMQIQSASATLDVGFDSNGNLNTASIATFAGSGDAFVKIWYDQSGNGNNATQTNTADQPKIYSGSQGSVILENGRPAIHFNEKSINTTAFLYSDIANRGISAFSVYSLVNYSGGLYDVDFTYTIGQGTGQNRLLELMVIGPTATPQNYNSIIQFGQPAVTSSFTYGQKVFSQIGGNSSSSLFINSSTAGISSPITFPAQTDPPHPIYLGSFLGGNRGNFKLQEFILYNTQQFANRTYIENNINSYFNAFTPTTDATPTPTTGFLNFTSPDSIVTNQTFTGFSYDRGNSTIMYVGETKGNSSVFTQDTNMSVVATTSSVGFGSTSNNLGRTYPVSGLKHVTLRFSSGSVDCFVNGIPVPANSVFPTGSSVAGGKFAIPVYTGSLGLFQVYNRPLTGDEIWSNYQLTAPRYGLGAVQNKPYTLDDNAYLFLSQSGITDPIITGSINTFVLGLKSASLWDKMIAIYPFVGTGSVGVNLTGSHRWNLKEPSLVTYPLSFTGSWSGSVSGSTPSGSNTNISIGGITPSQYYPFFNTQSAHISILSYDTPVSRSYLMGTGMTEDLAVSTLAGDYGTPAAAYSVRKVRTAYTGALMDVRRSYDNVTSSIGFVSNGDLDTGSLLDWVVPGRSTLPGAYSGLAAAYSLRRVSASYAGSVIDVRRDSDNTTGSVGFDINGNLDTGSLLAFVTGSAGTGSGFVAQWYDQSGNNRHATQTITGSQPLIVSSGSLVTDNNKPALDFNGTSNYLSFSDITATSNDSIFMLGRRKTDSSYGIILSNTTTTFPFFVGQRSDDTYVYLGDNGYTNSSSNTTTQDLLSSFAAGFGPSGGIMYKNSTLLSQTTYNPSSYQSTWNSIGARVQLGTYDYSNAYAQEILLYSNTNLTGSRTLIENNINSYYNIYTGSNHGFVARWYDQSGNNRHATQTATGSQPIIVLSGSIITENSRSALSFDGNNVLPFNGSFLANTKYSIFAAHSRNFSSGQNYILGGTGGTTNTNLHIGYTSNTSYGLNQYSNDLGGSIPAYTSPILQQFSLINGNLGKAIYYNSSLIASNSDTVNLSSYNGSSIGQYFSFLYKGKISEIVMYSSDLSSTRQPIEYGINSYYNIYPQTSSFATSSFTISAASGSVSASLNNRLTSGIASSGPLGLITVSRTGSNSLTIARNGVTSSFAVPASGALSTGIYLGAINNNSIALGNSPLNISFASVGTGLTNSDVQTLNRQVQLLKYNLQNPSIVTSSLVLNLDALIPSSYPGTGNTWFDLSGNGYNGTLTNGPTFANDNGGVIVLDGSDDYIDCGTNIRSVLHGNAGITFEGWYNLANITTDDGLFTVRASGDGNWFWNIRPGGADFWIGYSTSAATNIVTITNPFTGRLNTWTHIATSFTSGSLVTYINGAAINTTTTVGGTVNITSGAIFTIGNYTSPGNYSMQGKIGSFRTYNRNLSASEVLQNYNATRGRFGI